MTRSAAASLLRWSYSWCSLPHLHQASLLTCVCSSPPVKEPRSSRSFVLLLFVTRCLWVIPFVLSQQVSLCELTSIPACLISDLTVDIQSYTLVAPASYPCISPSLPASNLVIKSQNLHVIFFLMKTPILCLCFCLTLVSLWDVAFLQSWQFPTTLKLSGM